MNNSRVKPSDPSDIEVTMQGSSQGVESDYDGPSSNTDLVSSIPIEDDDDKSSQTNRKLNDQTVQCSVGPIINEVLTYLNNKCDLIPQYHLIKIVADFYSDNVIEAAKLLLHDTCPNHTGQRFKRRQGNDKKRKNIEDMLDMLTKCPLDQVPLYVARDLQNLPPIDITTIDASNMCAEIKNLKKQNAEKNPTNEILCKLDALKDEIQSESKREINMLKEQMGVLQNMLLADRSKSREMTTDNARNEDVTMPKQSISNKDALTRDQSKTALRGTNSQSMNQRPIKSVSFQGDETNNERRYMNQSDSEDGFTIVQRRRRSGYGLQAAGQNDHVGFVHQFHLVVPNLQNPRACRFCLSMQKS